jgi:hypothetical protein
VVAERSFSNRRPRLAIITYSRNRICIVDDTSRDALIAEITAAFDGVELGDGVTLHQARAIDDYYPPQIQKAKRLNDTE